MPEHQIVPAPEVEPDRLGDAASPSGQVAYGRECFRALLRAPSPACDTEQLQEYAAEKPTFVRPRQFLDYEARLGRIRLVRCLTAGACALWFGGIILAAVGAPIGAELAMNVVAFCSLGGALAVARETIAS